MAFSGSATATASCSAGERATGGGFEHTSVAADVRASAPVPGTAGATPTGWRVTLSLAASGTVYVICAAP